MGATGTTGGARRTPRPQGGERDRVAPPERFVEACRELTEASPRPEIEIDVLPPPRGLAPWSCAVAGTVESQHPDDEDLEELATGRFVLLHDPRGHEEWQGDFRVVTFARADLEPEIAEDPLLTEVGWAWLQEALDECGATARAASGTVSRSVSRGFGGLAAESDVTAVEIRASWTPAGGHLACHVEAWCMLLATIAGLPPVTEGVSVLPRRRGTR